MYELYDLLIGSWTLTGDMTYSRRCCTIPIVSNEIVMMAGDINYYGYLSSAELSNL